MGPIEYATRGMRTYNIGGRDRRWFVYQANDCGEYGSVSRGLDGAPMVFPTLLAAQSFIARMGGELLHTYDTTSA